MFLSWLFGAKHPSPTARPRGRHNRSSWASNFRPRLECLEERTLLSTGPVTHFEIETPHRIQAGVATTIEVEALDASNHRVSSYTGTVTLASTAVGAVGLPATYTFGAGYHGIHDFAVTFAVAGTSTVTATDNTIPIPITGSVSVVVNAAPVVPVVTHFEIEVHYSVQAGVATTIKVEALDASNHRVSSYTGTVTLTSSDLTAVGLPATYTFGAGDHGEHDFAVTFVTAGTPTVAATDINAITGSVIVHVR